MKNVGERIVGSVLAVVGITAMVVAFGSAAAHATPATGLSAGGSLARQDSSAPSDSSDSSSSEPSSDSSDTSDASDASDASDTSDTSDTTDSTDDTDTPSPTPTVTETTETPNEMPTTETDGTTSGEGGTSPLGLILLGGGVITAIAAYAVYRRGA